MGIPMILCVSIFLLDRIDMILQVFEPQSREGAKGFYFLLDRINRILQDIFSLP